MSGYISNQSNSKMKYFSNPVDKSSERQQCFFIQNKFNTDSPKQFQINLYPLA